VSSTVETGALFRTCHDRIYRYLLSLLNNPAEAEDLTQETFLRAYTHRDSLRDPNAVRGWLYRIATRICLDHLRRRVVQIPIDSDDDTRPPDAKLSESPLALEFAEREETGACVQRCLDFLSDRYRAVILLHEAHSLTTAEIASLLGETEGAIKIRLHRARRKLREIMQIGCAISESRDGVPCCEPKHADNDCGDENKKLLKH